MNPLAFVVGLLLLLGYVWNMNFQMSIHDNRGSSSEILGTQLRAYGNFVAAYASANPALNKDVTGEAPVPTWFNKPATMTAYAKAGSAFVWTTPPTLALASAAARTCGQYLNCGITKAGVLYRPGQVAPLAVTLPPGVPTDGALVIAL